jgi:hypothetical protein
MKILIEDMLRLSSPTRSYLWYEVYKQYLFNNKIIILRACRDQALGIK